MIFALLRQHPVFSGAGLRVQLTLGLAALVGGTAAAALAASGDAARSGDLFPQFPIVVTAVVWTILSVQLLMPGGRTRADMLAMSLPLGGRRLWLINSGALLLAGGLVIGVIVSTITLIDSLTPGNPGAALTAGNQLPLLASRLAAGYVAAAALLQLARPTEIRIPLSRWNLIWNLSVLAGIPAAIVGLRNHTLELCVGALAAAGAAGYISYRSAPAAYTLCPLRPEETDEAAAASAGWERYQSVSRAAAWFGLIRMLANGWKLAVVTATSLAFGIVQSGYIPNHRDGDDTLIQLAPNTVYILLAISVAFLLAVFRVDHLPVPRKTLLASVAGIALGTAAVGYGSGASGVLFRERGSLAFEVSARKSDRFPAYPTKHPVLRVPGEYLRLSWNGDVPELRAPWGEGHRAWSVPVVRGLRLVLYSPLGTAEAASADFVAWEASRALETVHGVKVSYQEIRDRHMSVDSNGRPELRQTIAALIPPGALPKSALRGAVFPTVFGAVIVGYFLCGALMLRAARAGLRPAAQKTYIIGTLGFLLFLYLVRVPLAISRLSSSWILGGAASAALRGVVEHIPGGIPIVWALSAGMGWAAWLVAVAQIRKAEFPARAPRGFCA